LGGESEEVTYTWQEIEQDWLGGVSGLAASSAEMVSAFNEVAARFGREWVEATRTRNGTASRGTSPTLYVVTLARLLRALDGAANSAALIEKVRRGNLDARAELIAIYLLRSENQQALVEVEPEIRVGGRNRKPDFRTRMPAEPWTYIEVTNPGSGSTEKCTYNWYNRLMAKQDENWLQRIRLTAADPMPWLSRARRLRQAAEDLWNSGNAHDRAPGSELGATVLYAAKNPDYTPPDTGGTTSDICFMLFGFALENLAKGIIVCRDPTRVTSSGFRGWDKGGHKLVELFELARFQLTEDERKLFERVTRLTEWKGRYPLPMRFDKVTLHEPLLGYIALGESWPPSEYKALCNLYDKAKAEFQHMMQATPPLAADHKFG